MIYNQVIIRTGEIFLKGKNRSYFERILHQNIQKLTKVSIKKLRFRWVANYFSEHQKLKYVFGLTSYSPALRVDKDMLEIKKSALSLLDSKKRSFKVQTKRSDKSFPSTSHEINIEIGKYIEENSKLRFDSENPEQILGVEINQDGTFLFLESIACFGGLPVGVEGKVGLLLEDEASLLAGLLFMKRGCDLELLSFEDKKLDISLLQKFTPKELNLVNVKDWKELERYVLSKNLAALVSAQNYDGYKKYPTSLLIFRPLIAYSEERIREELKMFGF